MASIVSIARRFRGLSETDRYEELAALFAGDAEQDELQFRALLCTALREEDVYPLTSAADNLAAQPE